ncbi:acyltransferase family protein [Aquihabitans daechungensis]|uniref:acyltransferase family protein n=1 Tax=Aquihabitans daechungensis TaxID=1052257 RepID=UPI003B9EF6FC
MEPEHRARWAHRPGLDGLRGLAVVAVVAYHLGYLHGGFLGVDVFLVLSGYLITGLALGEIGDTGGLSLRAFWGRRVRRLVPALLVVVLVVTLVALAIGWPRDQLRALGWDGVATLTWWANWRQVQGPSYWASGENLFRHAWSLSIEEQFYLVWPVVLVGAAAVARRTRRSVVPIVGAIALAGAVASAVWQVVLSHRLADEDLSRVYVGTDARAVAPLLGCALACLLAGRRPTAWAAGAIGRVVGAIGGVVLLVLVVVAEVASPALYRNAVLVVASLASAVVVARASALPEGDRSILGFAVTTRTARYLGLRSYAIYLWSWPIQVLVSFQWPDLAQAAVALVTVALSLVLAEISFRVLEDPIRRRTGWASRARFRRPAWGGVALGAAAVLIAAFVLAAPPPLHQQVDTAEAATEALRPVETTTTVPGPTTTLPPDEPEPLRVLVTGDSVAWTVGYYKPIDPMPEGIASIESRAIVGCGLLSAEAWGYPQGGPDGPIVRPGSGSCVKGPEAEALGLAAEPDVVLTFPGSWEWSQAEAPDGRMVPAQSPEMAEVLTSRLLDRIERANAAGARFAMVAYSCPGAKAAGVRKDSDFIRWINGVMADVVETANRDGGDAELIEPTEEICIDADPAGEPTQAKRDATGDEVHVDSWEGGAWIWHEWLGPALTAAS